MNKWKSTFIIQHLTFILVVLWGSIASAQAPKIEINPTRQPEPLPIAITDFAIGGGIGADMGMAQIGADLAAVVAQDLERSGLFRKVDPAAYMQDPASLAQGVRFADWRAIDSQLLVTGQVVPGTGGKLRVEFRLWDVFSEKQMEGVAFNTIPENWRRVAHKVSDAIYKRVTGEDGYFDTRVVYIAESGPATRRIKRLAIMDQDGANNRYLTDGQHLVLTPRFSPAMQQITFMAYYNNRPRVYLFDIETGRQQSLGDFPGMTFAPRFSPDGQSVIMSMSKNGNTDIWIMNLKTRAKRQLTFNPAIDTSPSFSPDGKYVVFESDRGGSQQLYTVPAGGGTATRITFGSGRYGSPVWSPRGDLIAFTRMYKGQFYIGVIRPDGSGERMLARAYHVESPTWAPNGRVLMYFSEKPVGARGQDRQSRLHSIDLTGFNQRVVQTPGNASDPAWSPLIP